MPFINIIFKRKGNPVIKPESEEKPKKISKELAMEYELQKVCKEFNLDPEEVKANYKCRKREYVVVRQISMTLFRLVVKSSLSKSGEIFNKDHATVLHSIKTVRNLRETDRKFRELTDPLLREVRLWNHY